jgi:membrane protein
VSTHDQRDRSAAPASQPPGPDAGPDSPTQLPKRSWWGAVKNTFKEFSRDNVTDWAAALTYYGILSIFPGLLVLVSLIGLVRTDIVKTVEDDITSVAPEDVGTFLSDAVAGVQGSQTAGLVAILGLLGAFWAASGYIGAFMRASNAIYDVPEGRPIWKTIPIRLAVTLVIGVMLVISAAIVVFTGPVAERAGDLLGLGSAAVTAWNILKWPVLVLLVSLMIAILYHASPNARQAGFRWVSPGSLLAVIAWLVASAGFAFYVASFGSYEKTYGAVAGVIIFLVWLWISNVAILFGAEFDAELERQRAIRAGFEDDREPFLQLRDDRKARSGQDADLR